METLARGELLELEAHGPTDIAVLDGRLWITRLRDATDYVVAAGETLHLPASEHTVVSALSPARLTVRSCPPVRTRAARAWAGLGLAGSRP